MLQGTLMKIKVGDNVHAVIKSSDVMVAVP